VRFFLADFWNFFALRHVASASMAATRDAEDEVADAAVPPPAEAAPDPLFVNLDPSQAATVISSYCVNCGETVRVHTGGRERVSEGFRSRREGRWGRGRRGCC
jgi:hypothetical protein